MNTLSLQRIQIGRKNCDQGLTFTGFHFSDSALMQNDAANELHTVRAHSQYAVCCLTANSKSLRQKVIQRLTFLIAALEFIGFFTELLIRQLADLRAKRFNPINDRHQFFDLTFRMCSKYFRDQSHRIDPFLRVSGRLYHKSHNKKRQKHNCLQKIQIYLRDDYLSVFLEFLFKACYVPPRQT